jgi:inner membrane protein
MDSLTQLTLGAAVGEAILGRKVGYRAAVWGGICGTIPDLDVFIPFGDAVADFTYHRSFSHSVFVLTLLTPILVWLILKFHPQTQAQHRGWLWLVLLALLTHPLLDCFTVYGTQILWPFSDVPITWSTVFIIDPLYTLPLVIGVLCALTLSRRRALGHRINLFALTMSLAYLAWSLGAKLHVESVARASLAQQQIEYHGLLTTPAPLNTVLWRVLAVAENEYHEGFYSFLDGTTDVQVQSYPRSLKTLAGVEQDWPVRRLQWFTKGFYRVSQEGKNLVITDLRMGLEPSYVFNFKVAEVGNPHAHPLDTPTEQIQVSVRNRDVLQWVWQRLWGDKTVTWVELSKTLP